jgi:IrrE N-terminal-like domain
MQGYTLARHLRKQMRFGNKPVGSVKDVCEKLDVALEKDRGISLFRAAACAQRGYEAHIIPSSSDPRMRFATSRDFAVVSALGRLIWEARKPDEQTICVAQGDYSILSDSRRANAFAAEFLLPTQVVSGIKPDSQELSEVADRYGISYEAANLHAMDIGRLSGHRLN